MQIDEVDRSLLNRIQIEFPLCNEPYNELGRQLGIDGDNVIHRISRLKDEGIVRTIGPVIDARCLGYQTTLVAMKINRSLLSKAEKTIANHPRISHGYERDHTYNVWCTFTVPPSIDIEDEIERFTKETGASTSLSLPALNIFKIGAYFDMDEKNESTYIPDRNDIPRNQTRLSTIDKLIINEIQQELSLVHTPFDVMAEQVDMGMERFLSYISSLHQRGIIRRFSASINHKRAGFVANAMACWIAGPDTISKAAHKLTALKQVSHCYERKTNPLWPYNLFAMLHSRSQEACQKLVDGITRQTGLVDFVLLYSTRELKKKRIHYTV